MYFNLIGIDGSGKDTLVEAIIPYFNNYIKVKEPGGTANADSIRSVLLYPEDTEINLMKLNNILKEVKNHKTKELLELAIKHINNNEMCEMYLFAAARNELMQDVIIPNRDSMHIIGNRSLACSMAYQGYAKGVGMDVVWDINEQLLNEKTTPDFEIFIDVPVSICMERTSKREEKNHFDREKEDFFIKVREGYLEYYNNYAPYRAFIIDAGTKNVEELRKEIVDLISMEYLFKTVETV